MENRNDYTVFTDSDCLTLKQLKRYVEEKTDSEERIYIERHLIDCPLCSEAYDGFIEHGRPSRLRKTIGTINRQLRQSSGLPTSTLGSLDVKRLSVVVILLLLIIGALYWGGSMLQSCSTSTNTTTPSDTTTSSPSFNPAPINLPPATTYFESRSNLYLFLTTDSLPPYSPTPQHHQPPPQRSDTLPTAATQLDTPASDTDSPVETEEAMVFEEDTAVEGGEDTTTTKTDTIQPAQYPGGQAAMEKFIQNNLKFPDTTIEGTVVISALVTENGALKELETQKGIDSTHNSAAIKVIQKMPSWIPAKQNNNPIERRVEIPVSFE